MTVIQLLGWVGGVTASAMWVPQFLALIRTRDTRGLSVPIWIVYVGTTTGWLAHGIRLGQLFMILANVVGLLATITSLVYLRRDGKLKHLWWVLGGVAFAALLIGLDARVGSAAFGATVVTPVAITMGIQGVELMRAPRVSGVSIGAWVWQLANQLVWGAWGLLTHEPGTIISAIVSTVLASYVLGWRLAREWGVGPVLAPPGVDAA